MSDAMTTLSPAEYAALKPMLYPRVTPETTLAMAQLRTQYLSLGLAVLRSQEPARSKSYALMHLENSLMWAIQGLALTGEPVLPLDVQVRKYLTGEEVPHDQPII